MPKVNVQREKGAVVLACRGGEHGGGRQNFTLTLTVRGMSALWASLAQSTGDDEEFEAEFEVAGELSTGAT
jgi:hypothetical protein